MGWHERDYNVEHHRESGSFGGIRRPPNCALALIVLHGLAFLLMLMLTAEQTGIEAPLVGLVKVQQHPAGIVLHPFATTRLLTVIFVALALWSLGGRLELRLGSARLLGVYLLGNLIAGGVYFVIARFRPALGLAPPDYPVGALAAMCVLAWRHLRQDAVQVLGKVTTIAKVYAVCAGIVVLLQFLRGGSGAVAWALAAAAAGAAVPLGDCLHRLSASLGRGRVVRPSVPRWRGGRPAPKGPDIDDNLAKISTSGLDSLTDADRERLEEARRARLRQHD